MASTPGQVFASRPDGSKGFTFGRGRSIGPPPGVLPTRASALSQFTSVLVAPPEPDISEATLIHDKDPPQNLSETDDSSLPDVAVQGAVLGEGQETPEAPQGSDTFNPNAFSNVSELQATTTSAVAFGSGGDVKGIFSRVAEQSRFLGTSPPLSDRPISGTPPMSEADLLKLISGASVQSRSGAISPASNMATSWPPRIKELVSQTQDGDWQSPGSAEEQASSKSANDGGTQFPETEQFGALHSLLSRRSSTPQQSLFPSVQQASAAGSAQTIRASGEQSAGNQQHLLQLLQMLQQQQQQQGSQSLPVPGSQQLNQQQQREQQFAQQREREQQFAQQQREQQYAQQQHREQQYAQQQQQQQQREQQFAQQQQREQQFAQQQQREQQFAQQQREQQLNQKQQILNHHHQQQLNQQQQQQLNQQQQQQQLNQLVRQLQLQQEAGANSQRSVAPSLAQQQQRQQNLALLLRQAAQAAGQQGLPQAQGQANLLQQQQQQQAGQQGQRNNIMELMQAAYAAQTAKAQEAAQVKSLLSMLSGQAQQPQVQQQYGLLNAAANAPGINLAQQALQHQNAPFMPTHRAQPQLVHAQQSGNPVLWNSPGAAATLAGFGNVQQGTALQTQGVQQQYGQRQAFVQGPAPSLNHAGSGSLGNLGNQQLLNLLAAQAQQSNVNTIGGGGLVGYNPSLARSTSGTLPQSLAPGMASAVPHAMPSARQPTWQPVDSQVQLGNSVANIARMQRQSDGAIAGDPNNSVMALLQRLAKADKERNP